jgi:Domain of unknown function (DUF5666)
MTEPTEPINPSFQGRVAGPNPVHPLAVLVVAVVVFVGAAVALGASPLPSSAPGASGDPVASAEPDEEVEDPDHWLQGPIGRGFGGLFGGRLGIHGPGRISITAISGSDVSLETDNGWRRTITVTDDTTIVRSGEEIGLADLRVGDRVGIREERTDDGAFRVTGLVVLLPTAWGEVTATTASTITVERFGGGTTTIHVDDDTTYRVRGVEEASLEDIEVGMGVFAQGTERADGSLDAEHVRAGNLRRGIDRDWRGDRDDRGLPWPRGPWGPEPLPESPSEPAPSAETSVG